jgi:glycosyltransferase involved in cell wall biosynthesis
MFSAVIPLYNKRAWIRRALDSIAAQEFPCSEVIVVNDGSTDGGDEVARAWGDPRIRIIDQPNSGLSAARNTGLAAAKQPFVAFLDADDEWLPAFLARMRSLIERHPRAVLYGSGFLAVADGREQRHGAAGTGPSGGPVDFFWEITRGHVVHPSGMAVPREAALAVGGFPRGVRCFEDTIFFIKLAFTGPFVLTPEPLIRYDMAVPGQMLVTWRDGPGLAFEPSDLDRCVADELRGRVNRRAVTQAEASFVSYARRHLSAAVLKRAYWGRFDAVSRLVHELRLSDLKLGLLTSVAAWSARHPATHPVLRSVLAVIRPIRQTFIRAFGNTA